MQLQLNVLFVGRTCKRQTVLPANNLVRHLKESHDVLGLLNRLFGNDVCHLCGKIFEPLPFLLFIAEKCDRCLPW